MLRIYNTLSKSKEPFEPVEPGKVGIYLCGPTVYKPSHIGHMVGPVIFDAIKRYLSYSGYEVTLVINVTDVDDKLIAENPFLALAGNGHGKVYELKPSQVDRLSLPAAHHDKIGFRGKTVEPCDAYGM